SPRRPWSLPRTTDGGSLRTALGDLDLGRREHRRVVSRHRQHWKLYRADSPAVVLQNTMKRRIALHVANKPDRSRVEIGGDRHRLFFGSLDDMRDRQVIAKRLPTAAVNVAHGRANLSIAIAVDFFLEEVNQAAVALEDGEDAQVRSGWSPGE